MKGRYRDSDGINYPFTIEESKLGKNLELNIDFDSIIDEGYKIIVLNHQPGIGKTYTVMDYLMRKCKEDDKFSFFYFTDRHKTIDEHIERLRDKDKEIVKTFAHWKGFGKHCDNEFVEKLLELNVPNNIIKKQFGLDEKYLQYKQQFEDNHRVFAPFYYLSSDYFKNNLPQIVFLDERITQIDTFYYDREKIIKGFEQFNAPQDFIERAKARDIDFFLDNNILDKIKSLYQQKIIATVNKGTKKLDKFKIFNPYNFEQYLKWCKIYNYKYDLYSLPLFYKALDVVTKGIPQVIIDATFNREMFSYFLESYNGEMKELIKDKFKGFKNLRIKILNSKATNEETKVYRMRPGGAWPKSSFTEHSDATWEWLLKDLHEARKIFGDANIGIITYKKLSWLFEAMNFDVEYFGSLRGTNRLENKIVLVIVGTWLPLPPSWKDKEAKKDKDYIDKLVEKYFLIRIDERDVTKASIGAPLPVELEHPKLYQAEDSKSRITVSIESKFKTEDNNKFTKKLVEYYGLPDADKVERFPISAINTIWFDEIYQAFHRNRGLRYPRIIFCYGWYPEQKMMIKFDKTWMPEGFFKYNLRKEFPSTIKIVEGKTPMEAIEDSDKENIFSYYRDKYKGGLMQELMKHIELDEKVNDIADLFHIHKKGEKRGWNTPPITELKKAYHNLKDIMSYSKK